jgi:hypothetical protein
MAESRVSFTSILSVRRKRGRPRLPSWDEILPSWDEILGLTPETAAWLDAQTWLHRLQTRNRGGRPADHDLNQKLLEGANDARRRGISLRDFCKIWFANKFGREPTPDEVKVVERRFGRARNRKSPK